MGECVGGGGWRERGKVEGRKEGERAGGNQVGRESWRKGRRAEG